MHGGDVRAGLHGLAATQEFIDLEIAFTEILEPT